MMGEGIDNILTDNLSGTASNYIAVFALEQLPQVLTRYPSAYVVKTDPSSDPGEHWVAFYHLTPPI